MVSIKRNVSAYTGAPPENDTSNRCIEGGPLYSKGDVLAVLAQGESSLLPWTKKCKNDIQAFSFDTRDAIKLVEEALKVGRFRNSEWCVQKPSGPWAACDAYELQRKEWVQVAHKEMLFNYFVKFAIGKAGKVLLLVSCHPSQDRS